VGVGVVVGVLLEVAVGVADGDNVAVGVVVLEHATRGTGQLGVLVDVAVEVLVGVVVGVGDVGLLTGGHFSSSALQ